MNTKKKVFLLFDHVLGKQFFQDNVEASEVEEWDSLRHINLVIELEKTFGVIFTPDEIADMFSSSNVIIKLVEEKKRQ